MRRSKDQYWGAQMFHIYKYSDTNSRFYLIISQFKLLTSGNSYIQLPYAQICIVVNAVFHFLKNFTSTRQGGETDLIQRIDSDVTNMNTISKRFIANPWKFKCPLTCPVQNNK